MIMPFVGRGRSTAPVFFSTRMRLILPLIALILICVICADFIRVNLEKEKKWT